MKPIMTDVKHKCENYRDARAHTVNGWHEIVPAELGAMVWKQKSTTIGGNKPDGFGRNGYISKRGFNPHT
jgi:hypothetical protein